MKMKKYLITAALAVAISGAFVSCSDDIASDSLIEQKAKAFDETFIQVFGTPAPNHTWGFRKNVTRATRGEYADANLWYQTYKVPANVTANEKKLVTDYFTDHLFENQYRVNNINFKDFFVYQVYKGEEVYTAHNGGSVLGSNHMDHLQTYVGGTMEQYEAGQNGVRREHMNNFNRGDNQDVVYWDKMPQTDEYKIVGAMLMVNSGTKDFSYNGTEDSQYHNTYVIIPGETIDPSLEGFWYVGFDFFENGQNSNQQVDRDWQFNDWIVRISPAEKKGGDTPPDGDEWEIVEVEEFVEGGRVFCEDLGASTRNDIDYNDIVFDAIIVHEYRKLITYKNGVKINETTEFSKNGYNGYDTYYAKVCLLAAGGTIPATVAGKEVHNVLGGKSTTVMINTTNDRTIDGRPVVYGAFAEHAPVEIDEEFYGIDNLDDIKIAVIYGNAVTELTAPEGAIPYKFCVPIGTKWAKERENIGVAYETFEDYCHTDPSIKFWEGRGVDESRLWEDCSSPFEIYKNYTEGEVMRYETIDSGTNSGNGDASGSELWRGNEDIDWSQKIIIEKEKFANATSSSTIRFHCTAGSGYKQMWLKTTGWQNIVQTYGSNDWNQDYIDLSIGGYLYTLQNNDVSVQGENLTCTYIELIP